MSEQEIFLGNKLIAEFMGLEKNDFGYWVNKDYLFDAQLKLFDFELKFYSSWDWLMPVVEKIESLIFLNKLLDFTTDEEWSVNVSIELDVCIIHHEDRNEHLFMPIISFKEGKIKATWFAVVEFIKWYNSCQK